MLIQYIKELIAYSGSRAVVTTVLFFFSGLTQGIGLVLIIPLLHTLGISETGGTSGITGFIRKAFNALGLPMNLYTVLGAYILIVSLFALIKRYQQVLNLSVQQGFVLHLRGRLYAALTYADWQFTVSRKSSDITHAITSDVQRVGQGTNFFLRFLSDIVLMVFQVGAAMLLSPSLTAVTIAFGGIMMLFMRPLNKKAMEIGASFRKSGQNMFSAVMEHLVGMKTAKSSGVEEHHLEQMQQIDRHRMDQRTGFARIQANTRMVYEIAAVVALSLYIIGTLKIKAFHTSVAELLVLVFIFTRMMPRFSSVMQSYQNIKNMIPSFKGITALYEQAVQAREFLPSTEVQPLEIEDKISFHDVSFRYSPESKTDALHRVSLDIPARRITAITGPSGAGKSTLADLLLGLLKPVDGKITVDGSEIKDDLIRNWRHSIGYVPQETFLFHDTVRVNMLWANPSASEEELWNAIEMAAAKEFVENLPKGLDTVIGDRGIKLSGGERQRLALARALLRNPRLLLLDEATSALDTENEQRILDAIQSLQDKLTIVIIAHRQSTIQCADQVIFLENGRAVRG